MGDWWYQHSKSDRTYGPNRWQDAENFWEGVDDSKSLGSGRFWKDTYANNSDFRMDCEYGPVASDVQKVVKVPTPPGPGVTPGDFDENEINSDLLILEKFKPKALCMYEKYLDSDYDKNVIAEKSGFAIILDKDYYKWLGLLKSYYNKYPWTDFWGNLDNAGCSAWTFR